MRTFFVFRLKKEFVSLYKDNASSLFRILKHLYYMKSYEMDYGISLFHQLTEQIDKQKINRSIYIKYHNDMVYSKNGTDHIINNLYKDEISILTIKNTYILITANHNYSSFFSIIQSFGEEFFVCDFTYQDYFWLNDIKILV
ncbi:MAG: sporulation inhibitor of replication protein SirA [Firmicutes bacterium]|nr:sporulation inhibitor of replication protein SirA [Bacillota bacterium]